MAHLRCCTALLLFLTLFALCVPPPTTAWTIPNPFQRPSNGFPVTINDQQIVLPNGVLAQVITAVPPGGLSNSKKKTPPKPPILFLHGSFHGAWCWRERYMPFFAEQGHPCVAFSWRGTGGTPAGKGVTKVRVVEDHCSDLEALLECLPSLLGSNENVRPIVVSHSMGGVVVMKFLDELYRRESNNKKRPGDLFAGIVSLCSVPPSGNSKTTMRYLRRSLLDTYKITVGFVLKKVITDDDICRECFFGGPTKVLEDGTIEDWGISDADLARYQGYFERDTRAILDVSDLNRCVPSKTVTGTDGRAPFCNNNNNDDDDDDLPPCLVVGARGDFIVDDVANAETAAYYGVGVEAVRYVDSPHDIMLGKNWKNGADVLNEWIRENFAL
eukprot:CAMPEP_0172358108 /NCGR_PEP_ID=MMETSP1060-20121228/2419_1 /TAXON_ID=37318 /ORGANISM="Pseudo-nitzschia pungens, Strain cf. cingulata" /LENGTH=384 /DNA_ID=CAMNT_0013079131 /DNA_START=103 /DNA_END=1257 /DNA_ORIENTATION=-